MGKQAAFFVEPSSGGIPSELWTTVVKKVETHLLQSSSFSKILTEADLAPIWNQNPILKQEQHRYITTLGLAGISDRDLSIKLGKKLNVDQFFLLQLEDYPCTEKCDSPQQFFLRFTIVDTQTSETIWRGRIHYEPDVEELQAEAYTALVLSLTDELIEALAQGFAIPWHQWRYEHLKQLHTSG